MTNWTVITGDCLDVMAGLEGIDAVITDPPYGIGAANMNLGFSQSSRLEKSDWDSAIPLPETIAAVLAAAPVVVIWGGNYFGLPPTRGFLIWDKGGGFRARSFSECEFAWTNLNRPARIFTRDPLANRDYIGRQHKTQKPIALMEWVIESCTQPGDTILDPFCGSGTTGVACMQTGRNFIGIEIDPHYADIARQRISKAAEQAQQLVLV